MPSYSPKPGLFGKKVRMTQTLYDNNGSLYPVTLLKFGINQISSIKTQARDGYSAIGVSYNETTQNRLHRSGISSLRRLRQETQGNDNRSTLPKRFFKNSGSFNVKCPPNTECPPYEIGQYLDVRNFQVGQIVTVKGSKIGKGFLSNIKRNHFNRGPLSHGSKNHRAPGSIGAGTTPGRVYPGKKMAGTSSAASVVYSRILAIDPINNLLILKGSVPGKSGNFLKVY